MDPSVGHAWPQDGETHDGANQWGNCYTATEMQAQSAKECCADARGKAQVVVVAGSGVARWRPFILVGLMLQASDGV